MLQIIRKLLVEQLEDIDAGNTYLNEEEQLRIIDFLKSLRKDEGMSKATACKYLNMSRASFDNLVKLGKLPKGKKVVGFKELRWFKKDLDQCVEQIKSNRNDNTKKGSNTNI